MVKGLNNLVKIISICFSYKKWKGSGIIYLKWWLSSYSLYLRSTRQYSSLLLFFSRQQHLQFLFVIEKEDNLLLFSKGLLLDLYLLHQLFLPVGINLPLVLILTLLLPPPEILNLKQDITMFWSIGIFFNAWISKFSQKYP